MLHSRNGQYYLKYICRGNMLAAQLHQRNLFIKLFLYCNCRTSALGYSPNSGKELVRDRDLGRPRSHISKKRNSNHLHCRPFLQQLTASNVLSDLLHLASKANPQHRLDAPQAMKSSLPIALPFLCLCWATLASAAATSGYGTSESSSL